MHIDPYRGSWRICSRTLPGFLEDLFMDPYRILGDLIMDPSWEICSWTRIRYLEDLFMDPCKVPWGSVHVAF